MQNLIQIALKAGSTHAKLMDVKDIIVDERVRLKCFIPRCNAYNNCLTCPPHTMSVKEFQEILSHYDRALIVQVEADQNSMDKSDSLGLGDFIILKEHYEMLLPYKFRLAEVIEEVEKEAFKQGYPFAAGLGVGQCNLCGSQCPGVLDGQCRHPFRARPAMEAMGIDVQRTAEKAGFSIKLSSSEAVKATGLILID